MSDNNHSARKQAEKEDRQRRNKEAYADRQVRFVVSCRSVSGFLSAFYFDDDEVLSLTLNSLSL